MPGQDAIIIDDEDEDCEDFMDVVEGDGGHGADEDSCIYLSEEESDHVDNPAPLKRSSTQILRELIAIGEDLAQID